MDDSWLEKIRLRIMQEAYNFADDDNREAYNAIKVMCNDVLNMIQEKRQWVGLTEEETREISFNLPIKWTGHLQGTSSIYDFARAIEAKLKEKNT